MSFVPQPYEQFVDDLLTALTGGTVREEHQFTGTDSPYSLSQQGAIRFTLKVTGQRDEQFAVFEDGNEFSYDETQAAVRWKAGAKLPDDQSYFYVNYYVQGAPARLTDRNPGSVTTTLAEAFAREFAVLHKQMDGIYQSAFINLASGSSLDHVAALLDVTRKDARFAAGEVLFKRGTPAPGDIVIPAGTVVSTDQGQNFETTDKRTLRRGQLSVTAPIRAQVEGTSGKVDASTIKNINRPIFGIDSVQNDAASFFASAKETDAELRQRVRGAIERAGKSTVDAIRYGLIEDIPEITQENVQVSENPDTPGVVQVNLGIETSTPDLVARIEDSLLNSRPAGIRVIHNLPSEATSASRAAADAITRQQAVDDLKGQGELPDLRHIKPEILATLPDRVLPMRAEVLLRLADTNLSTAQKESIEDGIRTAVTGYINGLPIGASLIFNKLLGLIVQPDQIADVALLVGAEAGGVFYSFKTNLASDGRKPKIDPHRVFVGLMDEAVSIDVVAQLEPNPADTTPGPRQASDALQSAVTLAISRILASGTRNVAKKDIVDAIRAILAGPPPQPLQLAAGDAVALNATFKESGRLLNNTDALVLADNEAPSLANLTLNVTGSL
jgi:uncharacterized phage protein gp47/JayE